MQLCQGRPIQSGLRAKLFLKNFLAHFLPKKLRTLNGQNTNNSPNFPPNLGHTFGHGVQHAQKLFLWPKLDSKFKELSTFWPFFPQFLTASGPNYGKKAENCGPMTNLAWTPLNQFIKFLKILTHQIFSNVQRQHK